MRPYLLAAALLACAGAAAPASAAGCAALARTPATSGAIVMASGSFTCVTPESGMRVSVCVQVFRDLGWHDLGCAAKTASTVTTSVAQDVAVCYTDGPALVRATAVGSNADGDVAKAASAPTWAPGFGSCGP